MRLIELKCKNCNGALDPDTLKCPYCGTQYKEEKGSGITHYVQTCPPSITPLHYQMRIDESMMGRIPPEKMSEIVLKEITSALAHELIPFVEIESERDIFTMKRIIRGTVRVVDPDFRF